MGSLKPSLKRPNALIYNLLRHFVVPKKSKQNTLAANLLFPFIPPLPWPPYLVVPGPIYYSS
jgi:hypothetical protein